MELIQIQINLFRQCLLEVYAKWFGWYVGFVLLNYKGNQRYPQNNIADIYIGWKGFYLLNVEIFSGRGHGDHMEIGILNNYVFLFYAGK